MGSLTVCQTRSDQNFSLISLFVEKKPTKVGTRNVLQADAKITRQFNLLALHCAGSETQPNSHCQSALSACIYADALVRRSRMHRRKLCTRRGHERQEHLQSQFERQRLGGCIGIGWDSQLLQGASFFKAPRCSADIGSRNVF